MFKSNVFCLFFFRVVLTVIASTSLAMVEEEQAKKAKKSIYILLENEVDKRTKDLFKVIKEQKVLEDVDQGFAFRVSHLSTEEDQKLAQEIREELKLFDVPDFLITKIPVLNMEYVEGKESNTIAVTQHFEVNTKKQGNFFFPHAILFKKEDDLLTKRFSLFHEVGHVALSSTICFDRSVKNVELSEIFADLFSICSLFRRGEKEEIIFEFIKTKIKKSRSKIYLTKEELLYCANELFQILQKEKKLNLLTYARKIASNRKEGTTSLFSQ